MSEPPGPSASRRRQPAEGPGFVLGALRRGRQGGRGAGGQRSRGAEGQRSRGAEEQRSRGDRPRDRRRVGLRASVSSPSAGYQSIRVSVGGISEDQDIR